VTGYAYRILLGKHLGKHPLRRLGSRCENNVKMDFREIGCEIGL